MGGPGSGRNPKTHDPAGRAKEIARLRASGLTLREIGARIGLSRQMVKVILNRLGHPTPALPGRPGGFAGMTPEQRRAAGRKGMRTLHATGKAHHWSHAEAVEAGRKGGKAAQDRGTGFRFTSETGREAGRKGRRGNRWAQGPAK